MSTHPTGFILRPAQKDEIPSAARIVAESFGPVEPYLAWLFPADSDRATASLPLVTHWAEEAFADGTLMVAVTDLQHEKEHELAAPQVAGVALWTVENAFYLNSPNHLFTSWKNRVHAAQHALRSVPTLWGLLGKHTWRYYYEAFLAKRARGFNAQCYLSCLAVSSKFRGHGLATALLNYPPRPDLPLTLECRDELIDFYSHHGFHRGLSYRLPQTSTMVSFHRYP